MDLSQSYKYSIAYLEYNYVLEEINNLRRYLNIYLLIDSFAIEHR